MHETTTRARVQRVVGTTPSDGEDVIAMEEPLEIRVGEKPVSVTLRTPGDDFDLATGFLFTESILTSIAEVESVRHWGSPNIVRVGLHGNVQLDLQRLQRHFYSTSSCGVCGKASIDALRIAVAPVTSDIRVTAGGVHQLAEAMRSAQVAFETTGAIHAAAMFTSDGSLVALREDVGRHNAVDKAIGSFFRQGCAPSEHILFVSGRTSFEVVQKAAVARVPVIAAVGAPTSLAVQLARELGITLLGFVRDGRFNVYAGEHRVG